MRRIVIGSLLLAGCRQIAGLHDLELDGDASSEVGGGELAPSNSLIVDHATMGEPAITINDVVMFDTDTGQLSGSLVRAPGEGIVSGIQYSHAEFGGAPLGVFAMKSLTVSPSGVIKLQGTRSAVFIVETTAQIGGKIDGSGGCADPTMRRCPGSGGGEGSIAPGPAGGCAPGQPGNTDLPTGADSGGGGGGGSQPGANGGTEIAMSMTFPGGTGGPRCMTSELEPLLGGGGGGGGGKGTAPQGAAGGGGGGAFQLSAFASITVTGVITMAGAGGEGGPKDGGSNNGGAGGGGGGGGSVLLEAPTVTISGTIAANGGGGGGGSQLMNGGQPGASGTANASPAPGGAPGGTAGLGGNGGALDVDATPGANTTSVSSGGGGGGAGRIFLRATGGPNVTGATISPAPGVGEIRTR